MFWVYFYGAPSFAAGHVNGGVKIPSTFGLRSVVSSTPTSLIVPEPEKYALLFGLFASVFVVVRRITQKSKRQQVAASQ